MRAQAPAGKRRAPARHRSGKLLGAIDVGSNASRLYIARTREDGLIESVDYIREPLRLGHDVFTSGSLSEQTIAQAVGVFQLFRRALDRHRVTRLRACATSAVRDARNRDLFCARVARQAGITLDVIAGGEEANLLRQAVTARMALGARPALLVDVGGGSTEVSVLHKDEVQLSESFTVGTVRMIEAFGHDGPGKKRAQRLMTELCDRIAITVRERFEKSKVDLVVCTGGNIEAVAQLVEPARARAAAEGHGVVVIPVERLKVLRKELEALSLAQRLRKYKLRADRADVVVPALHIYYRVARTIGASAVQVPFVGLVNGIVEGMRVATGGRGQSQRARQVRTSALVHGRRFAFDERHARQVATLASRIFDATGDLHRLDDEARLLLETAALLHDIGAFVEPRRHHKHSAYLIANLEIVGLSQREGQLVASIARYHRKSLPTTHHEAFAALSIPDRDLVSRLSAILRIADALDREHGALVEALTIDRKKGEILLRPYAARDLLLEAWALEQRADLFEQLFGLKVRLLPPATRPPRGRTRAA